MDWFAAGQEQTEFKSEWLNPIDQDRDEQAVFSALLDDEQQIVTSSIQTRDWKYIRDCEGQDEAKPKAELYSKPDDRWEINNVADRGWADAKPLKRRLQQQQADYTGKNEA